MNEASQPTSGAVAASAVAGLLCQAAYAVTGATCRHHSPSNRGRSKAAVARVAAVRSVASQPMPAACGATPRQRSAQGPSRQHQHGKTCSSTASGSSLCSSTGSGGSFAPGEFCSNGFSRTAAMEWDGIAIGGAYTRIQASVSTCTVGEAIRHTGRCPGWLAQEWCRGS